MAMATRAPIRVAGKSWPTMASAIVSERANGCSGVILLPTVVSVPKLKYISFDVSRSMSVGAVTKLKDPARTVCLFA